MSGARRSGPDARQCDHDGQPRCSRWARSGTRLNWVVLAYSQDFGWGTLGGSRRPTGQNPPGRAAYGASTQHVRSDLWELRSTPRFRRRCRSSTTNAASPECTLNDVGPHCIQPLGCWLDHHHGIGVRRLDLPLVCPEQAKEHRFAFGVVPDHLNAARDGYTQSSLDLRTD